MTLPGIGVVLAIGTALAGVLYLLYQQNNVPIQHTYGSSDRDYVYTEPPWMGSPPPERPPSRKKKNPLCSICLEGSGRGMVTLNCNHLFHKHCIDIWLMNHNTCPNCRQVI